MLRRLLDRPVAVTMIAVVLVILGVVSSRLLPVSLVPDIDAPYITVQIPAQGVPARQLNETVVIPLSRQLIQPRSSRTSAATPAKAAPSSALTFEQGADIDYLFIEVNEKIDRSISSLPRDLERPKVIKASATDIPAFYINLTVRDERPAPAQDELHPRVGAVRGPEPLRLAGHHQAHRTTARGGDGGHERQRGVRNPHHPGRDEAAAGRHHDRGGRKRPQAGRRHAGQPHDPRRRVPVQREVQPGAGRPGRTSNGSS